MPTLLHRLASWAESDPEAPAQRYKEKGVWKTITAREYADRVYYLALFLESRGISSKDTGCVYSTNNPQYVHLDLAMPLLGGRSAGIYPNSTGKDVSYILEHTDARVFSVQNKEFFGKLTVPAKVELIIALDNDVSYSPKAVAYKDALAQGKKLAKAGGAKPLVDYLAALDANAGSFLIYTSGTTGNPKGALLSHDNFCYTSDIVDQFWELPDHGSMFSFLPLCHVAEKLQSVAVGISRRYVVNFCTKFENVASELPEVQPTLLLCVPRLWEKMMEGVQNKIGRTTGVKQKLATWAFDVGARVATAKYSGQTPNPLDLLQLKVADRLVLGAVREALGIAEAQTLASGAAALAPHVSKWFRALSVEILEDYGQTESTGVVCMTVRNVECAGTVGKPLPGIEVKIADDGEILTRGRHVFKGYYKDDAATAATVIDGWLHTGDLGETTETGMIRIRGRKKEVLKTSGGKMVAPLPIEEEIKASPLIGQVCLVGDGRKYLSALVTLSDSAQVEFKSELGAVKGATIDSPAVIAKVKAEIDKVNAHMASYEQIKRFAVMAKDFSIEAGEMTATLKMKRNVIEKNYQAVIDQLYG